MLEFALKTAEEAGTIAMKHFRRVKKVRFKSRQDLLTIADTEVEDFIKKGIRERFPEHGILAEESGEYSGSSDYLWVIDPIDGTVNYAVGFPYFSISIGLAFKEQPILGVVYNPCSKEFIYAEKKRGAYLNGRRIRVGNEKKLINSVVATDLGHRRSRQIAKRVKALIPVTRAVRIMGSACLALTDVALNRVQAYVHNDLQPWDVAAAYVVVKEAGGEVVDFNGKPWELYDRTIIASNKHLCKELPRYVRW